MLRRQRGILDPMGGPKVWEDVLWVISALERAHPMLAPQEGPQLEYPWEDIHGEVRWPARDLAIANALGDPSKTLGPRVLHFAEQLSRHFDTMFGWRVRPRGRFPSTCEVMAKRGTLHGPCPRTRIRSGRSCLRAPAWRGAGERVVVSAHAAAIGKEPPTEPPSRRTIARASSSHAEAC